MKRIVVLFFCLMAYSAAGAFELSPADKKFLQLFHSYIELSVGGIFSVVDYKTKSKTNYYHDSERDEMVYDKDLYYDIYSFEGGGPRLDSKVGFTIVRTVALFLNIGCYWSIGEHRYKEYSHDEEEFSENNVRFRPYWGIGIKWYPSINEQNPFNGIFIGATVKGVFLNGNTKSWQKYGMHYTNEISVLEFELGKLWKVSELYYVGFAIKVAGGYAGNTKPVDGFRVDANREQDDDDITLNSKHIGAAITLVRK